MTLQTTEFESTAGPIDGQQRLRDDHEGSPLDQRRRTLHLYPVSSRTSSGNPNPMMMRSALNTVDAHSESTAMIGDRMDTESSVGSRPASKQSSCSPASAPAKKRSDTRTDRLASSTRSSTSSTRSERGRRLGRPATGL